MSQVSAKTVIVIELHLTHMLNTTVNSSCILRQFLYCTVRAYMLTMMVSNSV